MTRLLEALTCFAIAGVLYVLVRGCIRSGVITWDSFPQTTREQYPVIFQASIIGQYVLIGVALAGAFWCLFLQ
jgi:hypothetical protein